MIKEITNIKSNFNSISEIYHSVGRDAYIEFPEDLKKSLSNSSYIHGFYEDGELVGLIRGLTDDVSVHYIQEIIVLPEAKTKGIRSQLVNFAHKNLDQVRTHILLTDEKPSQLGVYRKLNFSNTKSFKNTILNAFVKFRGVRLG